MTTPVRGPSLEELDSAADRYERLVARETAKVANLAARRVRRASSLATLSADDLNVVFAAWQEAVTDSLLPALEEAWLDAANGQLDRVRKALPLTAAVAPAVPLPFVPGDRAAASHLASASNRLVGIGDEYWNAARTSLTKGMAAGRSIPDLAKGVQEAAGVARPRATVIARTEVISASNVGSITAMRSTEGLVTTKEWLATGDARTRPSHADADGQVVPLNELFQVGMDQLDEPGDPNGSPEETVNCRCTMTFGLDDEPAAETVEEDPLDLAAVDATTLRLQQEAGFGGMRRDDGLTMIANSRGFNSATRLVSQGDFDDLTTARGWTATYRGLHADTPDLVDDYASVWARGEAAYPGTGAYGSGTYTTISREYADGYGKDWGVQGRTTRIALSPDANVVRNRDLDRLMDEAGGGDYRNLPVSMQDPGRFAAYHGYDAILVTRAGGTENFYVILNRAKTATVE